MKHKRLLIIVLLMACVSLACSLPFLVKDEAAPGQPEAVQEQAEPGQPAEQEGPGLIEGLVDSVISEPNPNPVSFNRGLSTLNAYVVTGELEMSGPSAQEISRMILKQEFDQVSDAMLRTIYNYSQTLEDPEPSESTMYIWRVGNDTCNGTDDPEDDYEFDSMEPDLREISDLMSDIFDMTFLVENPVFVGEEVIRVSLDAGDQVPRVAEFKVFPGSGGVSVLARSPIDIQSISVREAGEPIVAKP